MCRRILKLTSRWRGSYWAVPSCGIVIVLYRVVSILESVDEILSVKLKDKYRAVLCSAAL